MHSDLQHVVEHFEKKIKAREALIAGAKVRRDNGLRSRGRRLADDLLGTSDAAPDELFETEGLAEEVDLYVRLCCSCNWWVELGDMIDDENCKDCIDG